METWYEIQDDIFDDGSVCEHAHVDNPNGPGIVDCVYSTEAEAWAAKRQHPHLKDCRVVRVTVTVLTEPVPRSESRARSVADQEKWIAEHGGTEAGYIARYGTYKLPGYYGNGGEAIYAADMAELERLKQLQR